MENDSGTIFRKLKEDLTAYLELKIAYLKVCSFEQIGKVISVLCYGLIWIFLLFFVNLFIFITLGFYLGTLFNNMGIGFACIAAVYLLTVGLLYLKRKSIKRQIENVVIRLLTEDENSNKTNHE